MTELTHTSHSDSAPYTIEAWDRVDEQLIIFTDYVEEGDEIQLWRNPDEEQGFLGVRVVVREDDDWYLRDLTPAENAERTERILSGVRRGA